MNLASAHCRRLIQADTGALGVFFERNNRAEIRDSFFPFSLTRETAQHLLHGAKEDLFFVLEDTEQIFAFSMLRGFDDGFTYPSFGIFVDYSCHGKGAGRRLTEWTLRWADQRGFAKVRLSVAKTNGMALRIYTSVGFVVTERKRTADGAENLIMYRTRPEDGVPVFVSTGALVPDETFSDRLSRWFDYGIHKVECGNYPEIDPETVMQQLKNSPLNLLIHNYFPPPRESLVLNLASPDPKSLAATRSFLRRAIESSVLIGARWFAFHAGLVLSPCGRDQFGFVFPEPSEADRRKALTRFVKEVAELARYAEDRGIQLLIENNVANKGNQGKLLLVTPDEFSELFERLPALPNLGILIDTGHLAVSARTYGFEADAFLCLKEKIKGFHLHENNGLEDQHLPVNRQSPSIRFTKRFSPEFVTLEGRYRNLAHLQSALWEIEKAFHE